MNAAASASRSPCMSGPGLMCTVTSWPADSSAAIIRKIDACPPEPFGGSGTSIVTASGRSGRLSFRSAGGGGATVSGRRAARAWASVRSKASACPTVDRYWRTSAAAASPIARRMSGSSINASSARSQPLTSAARRPVSPSRMASRKASVATATDGTPHALASSHFSSLFARQNGLSISSGARLMSKRAISAGRARHSTAGTRSIRSSNAAHSGPSDRGPTTRNLTSGRRDMIRSTAGPAASAKSRSWVRLPLA